MVKIGILGYGNLGRGVEAAIKKNDDMELVAVYTRRDPASLTIKTEGVAVKSTADLDTGKEDIDVLIICGGSATDLPEMTPKYAAMYNVIDSFDTHAKVPVHFANVDEASKKAGKVGIISCGWDPGMFSINRVYAHAVLPDGKDYTFWGKGVSQGHSDAVRRIEGVLDARQYTVPVPAALDAVRNGENPELSTRQKHTRECFAHGGSVIYSGESSDGTKHVIEYSLKLDSNPEFTGSVLAAYARAAARLNSEGVSGAKTVFDIAPAYLCAQSGEELRAHLL